MGPRLTDRFAPFEQLLPEQSEHAADVLRLLAALDIRGSVFHLIDWLEDEGDIFCTVLVDADLVVSFEVPKAMEPETVLDLKQSTTAQFRRDIGQGKQRIRLDETLKRVRSLLKGWQATQTSWASD